MLRADISEVRLMQPAQTDSNDVRDEACEFIQTLPKGMTWTQLAYHVEVRASIERGLEDIEAGRVYTTDEIKQQLGLST